MYLIIPNRLKPPLGDRHAAHLGVLPRYVSIHLPKYFSQENRTLTSEVAVYQGSWCTSAQTNTEHRRRGISLKSRESPTCENKVFNSHLLYTYCVVLSSDMFNSLWPPGI